MGGKTGDGRPLGDIARLEDEARKDIQSEIPSGKQNVFISFVEEDEREVNAFRGQSKNEDIDLDFNDWSVKEAYDSAKAEYIKGKIREKIRQCSVTVVYVSDHTSTSSWVDWEIRESIRLEKGVIAFHKGDSPPKQLPKALTEQGIKPIRWTAKGIARAIRSAKKNGKK